MGRASREKQERRARLRDRPGLERKLEQQCRLLNAQAELFDRGVPEAGLPLAVCIRVLVHQTPKSQSLLDQLDLKDSLRFRDTGSHIMPGNLLPNWAFVMLGITSGSGGDWVPPLDKIGPGREHPDLAFGAWWTTGHMTAKAGERAWSRRDVVLYVANIEGGAHIDPALREPELRALEEGNGWGLTITDPFTPDAKIRNGPVLPAVRQIAHELISTLEPIVSGLEQAQHLAGIA